METTENRPPVAATDQKQRLIRLAKKYGTPLYIYDGDAIAEKYRNFKNAFDVEDLRIHFATKALSNVAVLRLFKELGAGLDCVSVEEVKLGLKAGFLPEDIIFTPNGVAFSEYEEAIAIGVKITVDNISTLEKIGHAYPDLPIFVRLNPHLLAGGNHKISVGHIDSKFGISIHQMPIVKRLVKRYNLNIEGIHVHTGSDIIEADVFERIGNLILSIADEFENIQSIDLGSGFKVQYKENDLSTDIAKVGKQFSKMFNAYCKKNNRKITLRFEPGKFLVSEAGSFLTSVNVVKQTTSCTFLAVNSGFNHLIRPMFYNSHHEIDNISNPTAQKKMYSVVGYICESDTFAEDRLINEVRENDILRFKNAGAYCYSMASNYNSRLKPAEVLLIKGEAHLIRKRQQFNDLLVDQQMPEITDWA
ncbi:MAG: diaminopimelate decarboxylase [Flavobacteriales bacterium]|nr:diaminopimelate decarboxylase [Flavobacteriales bacterium]